MFSRTHFFLITLWFLFYW